MEACLGFAVMLLMFGLPVGIIVLALVFAAVMRKGQGDAWSAFARKTGLVLNPGGWFKAPTVTGAYKGFNVYLYTYTQGSGKSKTTYTSLVAYLPIPNRCHVRVTREGFLSRITKAFGAQDVQVGDPAFDQAYIVKSDTPQYVQKLLTAQIRGAMLSGGDIMNVTISKGTVFYNQTGVQRNADVLRYILDVLVLVAARLVEMETPQQRPPEPPPAVHLPPVSICDNCGADLSWEADRHKAVSTCEYCGKEHRFRFGTLSFRRR